MLAESACMPIPSEVSMLLAGGAVAGAHLNLPQLSHRRSGGIGYCRHGRRRNSSELSTADAAR